MATPSEGAPSQSDDSLRGLASEMIGLSDRRGKTPVLMVDRGIVLENVFFQHLTESLLEIAGRALRWEILQSSLTWFGKGWVQRERIRQMRHVVQRLESTSGERPAHSYRIEVQTCVVFSHAAGPLRPLVVGIADWEDTLPPWTHPLRLTNLPRTLRDIQLVAA